MPIIKSAIKRVKTTEKANAKNSSQLSKMRTAVKKFEKAKTAGADNVEQLFNEAVSAIDKAQSKGLIKANKAARDKSRMAARLAKYPHVTQKAKNNLKVNLIFYSLPPNYPPFAYFFNNFTIHYIKE